MSFTVEFSVGARQDILNIYHYIRREGKPLTAKIFSKDLTEACKSLADNPDRGHIPFELDGLSAIKCRQINFKKYRIIYQIYNNVVIIHGVIHGKRTVKESLKQRAMI
jgi:toxin ParE1/3/4